MEIPSHPQGPPSCASEDSSVSLLIDLPFTLRGDELRTLSQQMKIWNVGLRAGPKHRPDPHFLLPMLYTEVYEPAISWACLQPEGRRIHKICNLIAKATY